MLTKTSFYACFAAETSSQHDDDGTSWTTFSAFMKAPVLWLTSESKAVWTFFFVWAIDISDRDHLIGIDRPLERPCPERKALVQDVIIPVRQWGLETLQKSCLLCSYLHAAQLLALREHMVLLNLVRLWGTEIGPKVSVEKRPSQHHIWAYPASLFTSFSVRKWSWLFYCNLCSIWNITVTRICNVWSITLVLFRTAHPAVSTLLEPVILAVYMGRNVVRWNLCACWCSWSYLKPPNHFVHHCIVALHDIGLQCVLHAPQASLLCTGAAGGRPMTDNEHDAHADYLIMWKNKKVLRNAVFYEHVQMVKVYIWNGVGADNILLRADVNNFNVKSPLNGACTIGKTKREHFVDEWTVKNVIDEWARLHWNYNAIAMDACRTQRPCSFASYLKLFSSEDWNKEIKIAWLIPRPRLRIAILQKMFASFAARPQWAW